MVYKEKMIFSYLLEQVVCKSNTFLYYHYDLTTTMKLFFASILICCRSIAPDAECNHDALDGDVWFSIEQIEFEERFRILSRLMFKNSSAFAIDQFYRWRLTGHRNFLSKKFFCQKSVKLKKLSIVN